jgi:hypothetical protein
MPVVDRFCKVGNDFLLVVDDFFVKRKDFFLISLKNRDVDKGIPGIGGVQLSIILFPGGKENWLTTAHVG